MFKTRIYGVQLKITSVWGVRVKIFRKKILQGQAGKTFSRDLTKLRDRRIMQFYEQDLLIVWHHHAKFDSNRFSGNRDIMLLVCRVM